MPEPAAEVEVRRPAGGDELVAALALRRAIFCGEQGVSERDEVDGRDDDAVHLVAVSTARVVGTCRLLVEGETAKFGRLAVTGTERGRGTGAALLRAAEQAARGAGARRITLHAQAHARGLYARHGYAERGEPFEEAGIAHVTMEKRLA